jgi:hypothetical protein
MSHQTDTSQPAPQEPTQGSGGHTEKTSDPKEERERGRRFGITDTGSDPQPTPWTGPPPK